MRFLCAITFVFPNHQPFVNIPKIQIVIKYVFSSFVLIISLAWVSSAYTSENGCGAIRNPYLGQKPPGMIPQVFAPDVVTTEFYEFAGIFSPDMQAFYLIRQGGEYTKAAFVVIRNEAGLRNESVVSDYVGEPFISLDGDTLYLGNQYRERTSEGWSELKSLGSPFSKIPIMRLTVSSSGTYYFDARAKDAGLRRSRLINGEREEPIKLGKSVNTGQYITHPFIAPDESYLIWIYVRGDGYGDSDLYINFRNKNGSWDKGIRSIRNLKKVMPP